MLLLLLLLTPDSLLLLLQGDGCKRNEHATGAAEDNGGAQVGCGEEMLSEGVAEQV